MRQVVPLAHDVQMYVPFFGFGYKLTLTEPRGGGNVPTPKYAAAHLGVGMGDSSHLLPNSIG